MLSAPFAVAQDRSDHFRNHACRRGPLHGTDSMVLCCFVLLLLGLVVYEP
jgi:hypothetical protein